MIDKERIQRLEKRLEEDSWEIHKLPRGQGYVISWWDGDREKYVTETPISTAEFVELCQRLPYLESWA